MRATIVIEGTPAELAAIITTLRERGEVQFSVDPDLPVVLDWEAHPALQRLRQPEREIVRLDLAHEPRRRIAELLELTASTVTVYRRSIRLKLRALPPDQRPAFVREWLRRFPGGAASSHTP